MEKKSCGLGSPSKKPNCGKVVVECNDMFFLPFTLYFCWIAVGWGLVENIMIVDLNHPTRNPIEVKWWWNAIYSFLFSSPFSWDRIYGNVSITWIQILCWCSIYFGKPDIVINSLNSWTRGQVILLSSAPGTSSSARSHPYDSAGCFGGAGGWWTCQPKVTANLNLASDYFFIYVIYFVGLGLHQSYGSGEPICSFW